MSERLREIIANYIDIEQENIRLESRFVEDLGFTSFEFMCMLGEVEEEFDVEVDEGMAMQLRTVQEAVNYIEMLQNL